MCTRRQLATLVFPSLIAASLVAGCASDLDTAAQETQQSVRCAASVRVFPVRGRHNTGYDPAAGNSSLWTCNADRSNSDFAAGSHLGIDIWAARGTPVAATVDGTLRLVEHSAYSGNKLTIVDGCGWYHFYAHLDRFAPGVANGVQVRAGQVVGYVGNTGTASNGVIHLHYSLYPDGNYAAGINPWSRLHAVEQNSCGASSGGPGASGPTMDVTGDGNGDLVIHTRADSGAGELWIWQGNDVGFWETPKVAFQNSAFMTVAKIAVTDVTGDGAADVILLRPSGAASTDIHLLRGGANPTGLGTFIRTFGRPLESLQVAAGDVNGDGHGDLVIHTRADNGAGELWIWQGNDAGFWETPKVPFQNSAFMAVAKIAVTDVTGDGAADVILLRPTDAGTTDIHLLRGGANPTGLGTFIRTFGRPLVSLQIAAGDVTGDGKGDLVIHARADSGAGELWIWQGNDVGFWETPKIPFQNSAAFAQVKLAVTDVTGDGAADVLLLHPNAAGTTDIHLLAGGANPVGQGTFIRSFGRPLDRLTIPGGSDGAEVAP